MSNCDELSLIDLSAECVRELNKNNNCPVCDKAEIPRMRLPCGHSACKKCVTELEGCYICLTPPKSINSNKPIYDDVLTQHVKNVSHLFDTFQKVFCIDINERQRRLEQLKIEKELFPECIQAPQKYYNKRKSYNQSLKDKENRHSHFPEEYISPLKKNKMENSINYVQNWLNKNDKNLKRKPLGDININNVKIIRQQNKLNQKVESTNIKGYEKRQRKGRKRSLKTANSLVETQNTLDTYLAPKEKKSSKFILKKSEKYSKLDVKENTSLETDESGIIINDDSAVIIEDTQHSTDHTKPLLNNEIDKDTKAWLEVLKATQNESCAIDENKIISTESKNQTNERDIPKRFQLQHKVPYYKRSYLYKNCHLCSKNISLHSKNEYNIQSKEVHITIDSSRFTTTLIMAKNNDFIKKYNSILDIESNVEEVTDIDYLENMNLYNKDVTKPFNVQSPELFTVEENLNTKVTDNNDINDFNTELKKKTSITIAESDSSEDFEESRILEVTADVHTSSDYFEHDVLSQVENIEEHEQRPRRGPRGQTPDSTNSSDKENFDPNRQKKLEDMKKLCSKK